MSTLTYAEAIDSLEHDLRITVNQVAKHFFGTQNYFNKLNLHIHRAYQDWCYVNEIQDPAEYRQLLSEFYAGSAKKNEAFFILFEVIPTEFNVRGKWTPEPSRAIRNNAYSIKKPQQPETTHTVTKEDFEAVLNTDLVFGFSGTKEGGSKKICYNPWTMNFLVSINGVEKLCTQSPTKALDFYNNTY